MSEEQIPLSYGQEGIWAAERVSPGAATYVNFCAFDIFGPLDCALVEQALAVCVARHEALRTQTVEVDGWPAQIVPTGPLQVNFAVEYIEGRPDPALVTELVDTQAHTPIDLAVSPIRARLFVLDVEHHVFTLAVHHIAVDGEAMGVIFDELSHLYRSLRRGDLPGLSAPQLQQGDVAVWQRRQVENNAFASHMEFWTAQFDRVPTPAGPRSMFPHAGRRTWAGHRCDVVLPSDLRPRMEHACKRYGVTPYTMLLTAFKVFVAHLTSSFCVMVASPFSLRGRPETQGMVGYLSNELVLVTHLAPSVSVADAVELVRETVLGALEHQELPFELIRITPAAARLFAPGARQGFSFNYVQDDGKRLCFDGVRTVMREVERRLALSEIGLTVYEIDGLIAAQLVVDAELVSPAALHNWRMALEALIPAVMDDPMSPLSLLPGVQGLDHLPRLPEPPRVAEPRVDDGEEPSSPMEERMAKLWADVLGLERVGATDDFFLLGGNSLLAMRLVNRARVLFPTLSVRHLFERPTVRGLCSALPPLSDVPPAEEGAASLGSLNSDGDMVRCSFGQKRMWLLHQRDHDSTAYRTVSTVRVQGALDSLAWRRAVAAVVRQQPTLRTTYHVENGELCQRQIDEPFITRFVDLTQLEPPQAEHAAQDLVRQQTLLPFDLTVGPVFRALLIAMPNQEHVFSYVAHHICFDAQSEAALWSALDHAYAVERRVQTPVEWPVRNDYVEWARRQQTGLEVSEVDRRLAQWRDRLSDWSPPSLPAPPLGTAPDVAATVAVSLDLDVTERLLALARRHSCTTFTLLLAIFEAVLARICGDRQFTIGSAVDCRFDARLDDVVGYFGNLLLFRAQPVESDPFSVHLLKVHAETTATLQDADLPFEQVVRAAGHAGSADARLINAVFSWSEAATAPIELQGLRLFAQPTDVRRPEFPLGMLLTRGSDGIKGDIYYLPECVAPTVAPDLARRFTLVCQRLSEDPVGRQTIADLLSDVVDPAVAGEDSDDVVRPELESLSPAVVSAVSHVLGLLSPGSAEAFATMGDHGLSPAAAAGELSRILAIRVPVRLILDHPSVASLADALQRAFDARGRSDSRAVRGFGGLVAARPATILVTGATGMLGHFVLHRLRRAGIAVRASFRPETSSPPPTELAAETVSARLEEPESLAQAARGTAGVVHLAAGRAAPELNIAATEALLSTWNDGPFVLLSSVDVYSRLHDDVPISELSELDHDNSPSARVRIAVERLVQAAAASQGGPQITLLRVPHVWAPHSLCPWAIGQGPARLLYRAFRAGSDFVLPYADQLESQRYGDCWIDARDVAEAIALSLGRPAGGPLNLSAGFFSWTDLLTTVATLARLDVAIRYGGTRSGMYAETRRYDTSLMAQHIGPPRHVDWKATLREAYEGKAG